MIGEDSDMGFRSKPHMTIPTLCLHMILSLSSLDFKIPHRRIAEGSRIWPEYRLHSIVFAVRSLATIALYWYEDRVSTSKQPNYHWNALLVMLTMAMADLSTLSQKSPSKTIRDLSVPLVTSYFFSVCQFYATAGVLMGVRRYTIQFLNVIIVQINPFLMTLRRKNLLSHFWTVAIYGFLLVFGLSISILEYTRGEAGISRLRTVAFCGNLAILWRTSSSCSTLLLLPKGVCTVLQNKYLIWSVLAILSDKMLRSMSEIPEISAQRHAIYTTSFVLVFLNGYVKCTAKNYCDDQSINSNQYPRIRKKT